MENTVRQGNRTPRPSQLFRPPCPRSGYSAQSYDRGTIVRIGRMGLLGGTGVLERGAIATWQRPDRRAS